VASLIPGGTGWRFWPLEFFPEHAAEASVCYSTYHEAVDGLSRRVAAFGRRMAGISREPPPLPQTDRSLAPAGPSGHTAG
jgi:hypothetical protein